MPTALSRVRRILPTPTLADMSFAARGFPVAPTPVTRRLELVPEAVITGFERGADARDEAEIVSSLTDVDPEWIGLAYEGAVVALVVRDLMAFGRTHRAEDFVRGPAAPHIFMAWVGYGFLMSKLPRAIWTRAAPDFCSDPAFPALSWLAIDGYAFELAYFDHRKLIERQWVPRAYPWEGSREYFPHAFDQGIGRALWFVHGADCAAVAAAIGRFPRARRSDLWSGVGAAVSFVGGAPPEAVRSLALAAGTHGPDLGQGAVFAAKARRYSGLVPPQTDLATAVLCGLTVDAAVDLADEAGRASGGGPLPAYEEWRQRVRGRLAALAVPGAPAP